jgi:diphosphomevalonate decarboxylase
MTEAYFYQSIFARRLGSGSACRSVKGQVVVWGNQANIKGSSDLYGVEFPNTIHKNFRITKIPSY